MLDKEARRRSQEGLEIRALDESRVEEAVDVVARGMRDNPLHVAAYGEDPERRLRKVHRFVSAGFAVKDFSSHTLVARRADGAIVGVGGMLPPGDCLPTLGEKVRMMPRLLSNGPRTVGRVMRWLGVWDKHHPKERHWHLGPLAVDAHLQGTGVGSKLMQAFCAQWTPPERMPTWRPTRRSTSASTRGSASRWSARRRCLAPPTGSCSGGRNREVISPVE